jgi:hypothetical protein
MGHADMSRPGEGKGYIQVAPGSDPSALLAKAPRSGVTDA